MIRIATLLAASALVIVPVTAIAQSGGYEPVTTEVRYADLNLSTTSGQSALNGRIAAAVHKVCGVTSGRITLREVQAQRSCVSKARGEAFAAAKMLQTGTLAAR